MAEVTENFIDLRKILASKGIRLPGWVVGLLNRLLHVGEINRGLYEGRGVEGVDFARYVIEDHLNVTTLVEGAEHIPQEGSPIVAGNHPLGGPDGLALINAVGRYRRDVKFPVNDFLTYLPGVEDIFIPVDKVHRNGKAIASLEEAFASENVMLYFPAGVCSRRQGGVVQDLEWKPTFVKKAVQYHRDIIPVYFDARNRRRFYFLANLRKKLGIKFNFEMALLPGEMYAQRGKRFRLVVGQPIPWQRFDDSRSYKEWARLLREHVYQLKTDPKAVFAPMQACPQISQITQK